MASNPVKMGRLPKQERRYWAELIPSMLVSKTLRSLLFSLFSVFISSALSGCVVSTGELFSVPSVQNQDAGNFIIELQQAYFSLRPDNRRAADKSYLTPLYFPVPLSSRTEIPDRDASFSIEIGIAPKEEDLIANFRKITLRGGSGKIYSPVNLFGPTTYAFDKYPWHINQDDSVCRELGDINSLATLVTLKTNHWTCVVLTFNVRTPDPTEEFTLLIDGITDINHAAYSVPPIQFHKKSHWKHKPFFTIND